MLLGVSLWAVQSYNIFLKSPNLIKVLVISRLTVWYAFCCNLVLEENSRKKHAAYPFYDGVTFSNRGI